MKRKLPDSCLVVAGMVMAVALAVAPSATAQTGDKGSPVMKADLEKWLATIGKERAKAHWEFQIEDEKNNIKVAKQAIIDESVADVMRVGGPMDGSRFTNGALKFHDLAAMRKYIAKCEAQIAAAKERLKAEEPLYPELLSSRMIVGAVGRIRGEGFGDRAVRVVQVVDSQNMICDVGGKYVWIQDSTAGLVDDFVLDAEDRVYEVAGTARYKTAIGINTIFRVKRLEIDPKP